MSINQNAPPVNQRPPLGGKLMRHRNFRLFWFGESLSKLGTTITTMALPLVALKLLHADTMAIAVLSAAVWLPWLVIGLPAGAWVDRLPRRPLMITSNLFSALLLLSIPALAALDLLTIPYLMVAAIGIGAVSVPFTTACQVFVQDLVPRADIGEANAKLQGSESTAQLAGPSLGGLLTQWLGATIGPLVDGITFLVSAACLAGIRSEPEPLDAPAAPAPRTTQKTSLGAEIAIGLRFLAGNPYLRPLTIYTAAANLAAGGFEAIIVLFLVRDVGASPGITGLLIGVTSAGGLVGALLTTRFARRFGTARGTLLSEMVAMPCSLLIPFTTSGAGLAFFVAGGLVINAGTVVSSILTAGFRQTYCPSELLGRITSASRFLTFGSLPLGALLAGILASATTTRAALWGCCVLLAISGLVLMISPLRKFRNFPT